MRLAALFLVLAPAPPPPPVTAGYLAGDWTYRWCKVPGVITFRPDGTLGGFDRYDGHVGGYSGTWWIDRDGWLRLELILGDHGLPAGYRIEVRRLGKDCFGGDWCSSRVEFTRQP